MKKLLSTLLLIGYLFPITDLKELLKMDVVFAHFQETKKKDTTLSFFDFIVEHYVTDDHNNTDNDRDSQLPFKSHELGWATLTFVFIPNKAITLNFSTVPSIQRLFIIADEAPISSPHLAAVWNPPKLS